LTGIDEAHEEVADLSTVLGFIEQGVFATMETFP
jgi:hypothetical protein